MCYLNNVNGTNRIIVLNNGLMKLWNRFEIGSSIYYTLTIFTSYKILIDLY